MGKCLLLKGGSSAPSGLTLYNAGSMPSGDLVGKATTSQTSCTFGATEIDLYGKQNYYSFVRSAAKIDVTSLSSITVRAYVSSTKTSVFVYTANGDTDDANAAILTQTTAGTLAVADYTLDVSAAIGSYYLYVGGNTSGGNEGHVYVQKWWAE